MKQETADGVFLTPFWQMTIYLFYFNFVCDKSVKAIGEVRDGAKSVANVSSTVESLVLL
jgi:hypothetical protein